MSVIMSDELFSKINIILQQENCSLVKSDEYLEILKQIRNPELIIKDTYNFTLKENGSIRKSTLLQEFIDVLLSKDINIYNNYKNNIVNKFNLDITTLATYKNAVNKEKLHQEFNLCSKYGGHFCFNASKNEVGMVHKFSINNLYDINKKAYTLQIYNVRLLVFTLNLTNGETSLSEWLPYDDIKIINNEKRNILERIGF